MGDPMRTQLKLYRGGHMLYLDPGSRRAFSADAKASYCPPMLGGSGAASPGRHGPIGPVTVSPAMRVHAEAAPSGTATPANDARACSPPSSRTLRARAMTS